MNPIVFVPGIKGSGLENLYPMEPTTTWSGWKAVTGASLRSLMLSASGEADESDDVLTRPTQGLPVAYAKLIEGLRGRLEAPVYVFPYDWRLSSATNGRRLVGFVEHLRKKPMKTVPGWKDGERLVNVLCHSMGGLVARAALAEWGHARQTRPPVDNLVFVATPHLGSLDAVKAIIVGDTPVLDFRKELRKLARALPSVYELLPRFDAAVVERGGERRPLDPFALKHWQSNVTTPTDGLQDVTQERLTAARTFLEGLPWPTSAPCAVRGKVLSVYGLKEGSTLVQVPVDMKHQDPKRLYRFDEGTQGDGDEVVPVRSALPPGLAAPAVAIPFTSAGIWPSELPARLVSFHAFICALDETQSVISRFLTSPGTRKVEKLQPINVRLGLRATSHA